MTGQNDNHIEVLGDRCKYVVCHNNSNWVGKEFIFEVQDSERVILVMEGQEYGGTIENSMVIYWDDSDVWEIEEVANQLFNFTRMTNILRFSQC